jgi:hypothetical protein
VTPEATKRAPLWTAGAVLVSALYALVTLLLPARGLTFLWDDWQLLARLAHDAHPWLAPVNEHWKPLYVALFQLEHAAFGGNHTFFLATTFVLHVANVWLLAILLGQRTGDERAAALAAAAFGLTTTYREVLWWAGLGGLALAFAIVVLGFLAFERARERESTPWLLVALATVFLAPLAFGSGLALGPALALEGWFLAPSSRRRRLALLPLVPWILYLACYAWVAPPATGESVVRSLPRSAVFAVDALGLGVVGRNLLVPLPEEPASLERLGAALALAYVAVVAAAAFAFPEERRRLLLAQAFLALLIAPVALTRAHEPPIAAAWSRYQYFPAIAWTTTLALLLTPAFRRESRLALAALPLLTVLAFGHARAASEDRRPFAPPPRRDHPEFLRRLASAVAGARGPVYDARLPALLVQPDMNVRASDVLEALAPDLHPAWTRKLTEASWEPYESDPVVARLLLK